MLDSRPDKLLDREPPADCQPSLPPPSCPVSFLLPPKIFPELLQSGNDAKLSFFQLNGEKCRFLALSKSSLDELYLVETVFVLFVRLRLSGQERVWF